MDMFSRQEPAKPSRVYVRIPVKGTGKVFTKGNYIGAVVLNDISTTGLSLVVKNAEAFPDEFELKFRLKILWPLLTVRLQVKNRVKVPGGVRLGCTFEELAVYDRTLIEKYVISYCNYSLPAAMVSFAAFFCVVDAALRVFAYSLRLYYWLTKLGKNLQEVLAGDRYLALLLLYAIISSAAFLMAEISINKKKKWCWGVTLALVSISFLFALAKSIAYIKSNLWQSDIFLSKLFLTGQALFAAYLGFSIVKGVKSLGKMQSVSDIETTHRSHIVT